MERQVAELQKTASYNVAEARLAICKSQNIQSKEIPRLEQMAAEYVPNVAAPAESVSPYDVAIASLQEKPGLPEDRARNDLIVNRLREAGDKWKQDQAREAQVKAFESMPERINALENARATLRMAELIPAIPSFHLEASRQNLLALENSTDADGGVKAFWAQQRKDNIALHAHQDQQKADWTKRGEQHDADMKAALSLAPVEAPVVVERPKSAIETALMPPETPAP
jgi:hypothetical protein